MTSTTPPNRRRWLGRLLALGAGTAAASGVSQSATQPAPLPGDEAPHKIVYQLNRAEPE